MSEFPSPFCPKDCLFNGVPVVCDTDCLHSKDEVFKNPREIEIKWAGEWIKAKMVGKSQGKYYIESDKGNFTVSIGSPLIK